jgi:hypothetical protein
VRAEIGLFYHDAIRGKQKQHSALYRVKLRLGYSPATQSALIGYDYDFVVSQHQLLQHGHYAIKQHNVIRVVDIAHVSDYGAITVKKCGPSHGFFL